MRTSKTGCTIMKCITCYQQEVSEEMQEQGQYETEGGPH